MKAAAVLSVPPPSAVTLVSVVARRALVPAALRGNARRGAALVASAAPDGQVRPLRSLSVTVWLDWLARSVRLADEEEPGPGSGEVDRRDVAPRAGGHAGAAALGGGRRLLRRAAVLRPAARGRRRRQVRWRDL
jgi:hypothetical protein